MYSIYFSSLKLTFTRKRTRMCSCDHNSFAYAIFFLPVFADHEFTRHLTIILFG